MKNWDDRQRKTFFKVLVFGFLFLMISNAFGHLLMASTIMLGVGSVFAVDMMPKE